MYRLYNTPYNSYIVPLFVAGVIDCLVTRGETPQFGRFVDNNQVIPQLEDAEHTFILFNRYCSVLYSYFLSPLIDLILLTSGQVTAAPVTAPTSTMLRYL